MNVSKLTGKSGFSRFRWKGLLPYHAGIWLFAMLLLPIVTLADSAQDSSPSDVNPRQTPYSIVNHIGEPEQQISFGDGKLLTHRRTTDPFGMVIRGPFKGLPPVAEHPVSPVSQPDHPTQPVQTPVANNGPTFAEAVQQLPVGGVNLSTRELLIGSQRVREGDLLVLELSGRQFVVWVQSVDRRGVQFCDVNLQQHTLKLFRFGPTDLPERFAGRQLDVRDFLKQD
jgi:hypothetical protein